MQESVIPNWGQADFWRACAPSLHIDHKEFLGAQAPLNLSDGDLDVVRSMVREDGYFLLPPQPWDLPLERMVETVRQLDAEGLPLALAFVYDEFWCMFWRLDRILTGLLGPGYLRLPDFWVWLVDPQRGARGWHPHRDKNQGGLFPDGSPRSFTIWIPLTDATPRNSCMYVLPANCDPNYTTGGIPDMQQHLSDIRALPAQAGSALGWTQALLHWGSGSHPRETQARISIALEFQSANTPPFNQPLTPSNEIPSFELRLRLIGKQILQYQHMYPLSEPIAQLAQGLLAESKPKLATLNLQ